MMIVLVKPGYLENDLKALKSHLVHTGFAIQETQGASQIVLYILGDTTRFDEKTLYAFACVDSVIRVQKPFKESQKNNAQAPRDFMLNNVTYHKKHPLIIAGPCSVESAVQIDAIAHHVKQCGAHGLRGGAYKPRTSPYNFQGLGEKGLKMLSETAKKYDLLSVSEITNKDDLPLFESLIDIIQVGARNMQNYDLLKALGKSRKTILLKRGFVNTVDEWLMSAEYILSNGNRSVILCERGIRTFEPSTRHTLDLSSVLVAKKLSHLPVIVDPSHAAGTFEFVAPLAKAALAVGADGLMIEVHDAPERALSDGNQSLTFKNFSHLMATIKTLVNAL